MILDSQTGTDRYFAERPTLLQRAKAAIVRHWQVLAGLAVIVVITLLLATGN
jgi:hypothetical protein